MLISTSSKARLNKSSNKPDSELKEFENVRYSSFLYTSNRRYLIFCLQILNEHRRQGEEDNALQKRAEGKKAAARKKAARGSAAVNRKKTRSQAQAPVQEQELDLYDEDE